MNNSTDVQVVKSINIYQFNITLHHIKPIIWRRIQVPGDYNFKDLHYAIQDAMGWKDCHLHEFEMRNPKTGHKDLIMDPDPDFIYDFPIVLEDKAKIAEYFLSPKDKAIYEYNLVDNWTHDIVLEQILPAVTYPQCLAGKGACPNEDDDRWCYSSTDKFEFDPKSVKFNKRPCLGNRSSPPEDCGEEDRCNNFNAGDFDHKLIRSSNEVDLNSMNKATEAGPSKNCGGVDRGNDFNPKLMRLSNDADSNTMNKAGEIHLIKRACPPPDCGGVDRGNAFNPKLILLSNDADSNIVNKAREVHLIKRACPPTHCGGVDRGNFHKTISLGNDANLNSMNTATEASVNNRACPPKDYEVVNGCINVNSKNPELIRHSIAEYLYSRDKATETSQNNRACPPESSGGVARGNAFKAKDFDPKLTRLSNDVDLNSMNKAREEQVLKSSNVYQFKIILGRFKPQIWRRVQVPGEYSFKQLHYVIQKVMGWSNRHLHRFTMKTKTRREESFLLLSDPDYDFGVIRNESETKIAEHFLAPKVKAIYDYDLGFPWTHDIVLEKILPAVASITYPRCLAGRRKTPIEDPTESEQENEDLFYPNPDEDKFDPKSIKFS